MEGILKALARNPVIGGALVVGAVWFVYGRRLREEAASVINVVNPASEDNFMFRSVNTVGELFTDDEDFTLAGWLWKLTHPGVKLTPEAAARLAELEAGDANDSDTALWRQLTGG